jgi:hypothetical protein
MFAPLSPILSAAAEDYTGTGSVGRWIMSEEDNDSKRKKPGVFVQPVDHTSPSVGYPRKRSFDTYQTSSEQAPKMITMDGANDEDVETPVNYPSRSLSVDNAMQRPARLSKVHFLSDDDLTKLGTAQQPTGVPHTGSMSFNDPSYDQDLSSRKASTSTVGTDYLRPNAFAFHRDTFARFPHVLHLEDADYYSDYSESTNSTSGRRLSTYSGPLVPSDVIPRILQYYSFEDYKAARLVCRQWYKELPQPSFPAVFRMPHELIQQIYNYLSPNDFEAARHTCADWYLASLDRGIQDKMLSQAGCVSAFRADIRQHRMTISRKFPINRLSVPNDLGDDVYDDFLLDKELICGKRLATENRLSADWRASCVRGNVQHTSRLALMEEINFSQLFGKPASGREKRAFTVSACGRFLLVIHDENISLYALWNGELSLKPIVRLSVGAQIQKVSMDTSSGRYSVAALLSGRFGMLWDLASDTVQSRLRGSSGEPLDLGMHADLMSSTTTRGSTDMSTKSRDHHPNRRIHDQRRASVPAFVPEQVPF